jgi:pyridoxal 5'-phosphate synthase pdxT subunit
VKRPADLEGLDGLVMPGGESTTLSMLLESTGLFDAIAARLGSGSAPGREPEPGSGPGSGSTSDSDALPLFGTCAGLILVAHEVLDGRSDQRSFDVLDAVVRRNGYGRQAQSFEAELVLGSGEGPLMPAVFIRAPLIVSAGEEVEVLASLDGAPALVRQGSLLASSFHPELTADRRVHRIFAELCGAGAVSHPAQARLATHEQHENQPAKSGFFR